MPPDEEQVPEVAAVPCLSFLSTSPPRPFPPFFFISLPFSGARGEKQQAVKKIYSKKRWPSAKFLGPLHFQDTFLSRRRKKCFFNSSRIFSLSLTLLPKWKCSINAVVWPNVLYSKLINSEHFLQDKLFLKKVH